ncbi:VanZ like family protein [Prauserella alba]|nr:VanZ like family protein [Prauserella alba]
MEFLLHHFGRLIPVGVTMLIPASAAWLMLISRRRKRLPVRRAVTTASLDTAFCLVIGWILLLVAVPTAGDGRVHLLPGTDLLPVTADEEAAWQFAANLCLLLPPAMLLPLRWAWWRSTRRATVSAFAASCGIELMQYVAAIGRVASVDDVLVNTAGAMAGATVATWLTHSDPALLPPGLRIRGRTSSRTPRRAPTGGHAGLTAPDVADAQSSLRARRPRLMSERRFFAAIRRSCEPRVGFVGLRFFGGGAAASRSTVANRCRAASRLRSCSRCSAATTVSTPSLRRRSSRANSRDRNDSGTAADRATSNDNSTREDVVFTP